MNFLKEDTAERPGVALPFLDNQENNPAVVKRGPGCAVMDKVHEEYGLYMSTFKWTDEEFHIAGVTL